MENITIQKLKRSDAPLMGEAFAKSLKEDFTYYPEEARKKFLKIWDEKHFRKYKNVFIVAKNINRVIGFLIGRRQWANTGLGTIEWLWVEKIYRKKGVATGMLMKAEKIYLQTGHHKIDLEADNPKSWDIYKKLGFKEEGFRKDHAWHHNEYQYGKVLKK